MNDESGKPVRIQRKRSKGWKLPENTVCVSRGTKWGNPFIVGKHGDRARCIELFVNLLAGLVCITVDDSCTKAQFDLLESVCHGELKELRGKNLACWCRLDEPCHADVLLEIANRADGSSKQPV